MLGPHGRGCCHSAQNVTAAAAAAAKGPRRNRRGDRQGPKALVLEDARRAATGAAASGAKEPGATAAAATPAAATPAAGAGQGLVEVGARLDVLDPGLGLGPALRLEHHVVPARTSQLELTEAADDGGVFERGEVDGTAWLAVHALRSEVGQVLIVGSKISPLPLPMLVTFFQPAGHRRHMACVGRGDARPDRVSSLGHVDQSARSINRLPRALNRSRTYHEHQAEVNRRAFRCAALRKHNAKWGAQIAGVQQGLSRFR